MTQVSASLYCLYSALLEQEEKSRHGFFTRLGGCSIGPFTSLNVGTDVGDENHNVDENLARIAKTMGVEPSRLCTVQQVHSARVVEVTGDNYTQLAGQQADALLTQTPGLAVAVRTADCVPMLVVADGGATVAAVHGGWRGLAAGIIEAVIAGFAQKGVAANQLRVAIGPHIGPCCYRVGPEVTDALGAVSRVERQGQLFADLGATARQRFASAGVELDRVETIGPCVCCAEQRFFSHRRDMGTTGRQLAVAMVAADQ